MEEDNKTNEWRLNPLTNNFVLGTEDFYVSYSDKPWLGDSSETALYSKTIDDTWYILNGDWRKEYEPLVPLGFQACLDFYKTKKQEHRCSWSTDAIS